MTKPMSLKVEVLGRERIMLNNQIIPLNAFSAHQAREMFFLAVEQPTLKRDQISALLWPDLDPKQAANAFHVTKWRINTALGHRHLYRWNSFDQHYEFDSAQVTLVYDAILFEQKIDLARRLPAGKAALEAWQQAVNLYHGDYLPGIFSEWAQIKRQGLFMKFIDALLACGRLLVALEEREAALEFYRRVLHQDEYNEEAYQQVQQLRPSEASFYLDRVDCLPRPVMAQPVMQSLMMAP